MNDDQAERVYLAAQELAILVRDEGPDAVRRAAQKVLSAAGGDALAALTVAATAICVDHTFDTWWQNGLTAPAVRQLQPCGTHAAHVRHRLRGEPIDDECREGERAYQADKYLRSKGAVA